MSLDALRSLQEQASPGPWHTEDRHPGHVCVRREETGIVFCVSNDEPDEDEQNAANAKLAALATHLLPIAEALETTQCWSWGDGDCADLSPDDLCGRCKVLKALQEALDA